MTNTITTPSVKTMAEVAERLDNVKKIIVHPGDAHLDEFFASAIALAHKAMRSQKDAYETLATLDVPIERHEPTEAELEDPEVLVLDIGGKLDAEHMVFDHHQLERGTQECAYTLLAKHLLFDEGVTFAEWLKDMYPWYKTRAVVDSCGPFQAAKEAGTTWDVVSEFLGPCEEFVLRQFAAATDAERAALVKAFAVDIVDKMIAWDEVIRKLNFPKITDCGDVEIIDFTKADPAQTAAVSDAVTRKYDRGVAIFHDNRGSGLTLLRLKDDPRIDFAKVKDDPEVAFAHPGGFIAKTKSKSLDEALRLIEAAVV